MVYLYVRAHLSSQQFSHIYFLESQYQVSRSVDIFVNTMQLDDDPIPVRKIPYVKDLCEQLGFGTNPKQSAPFRDSLISWRKTYRSFTTWEAKTERYDLGVMTVEYLEGGGNGRKYFPTGLKYWPSNGVAPPQPIPEYPRDFQKYV